VCRASLLITLALTTAASGAEAGPPDDAELLRRAEAAFLRGAAQRSDPDRARQDFAESARCYDLLRRRGADNAELYRNQGNAHLLAGELPEAILAYRRGLRCAPHDAGLRENLDYARDQVHYGPEGLGRPDDALWPVWLPRIDRAFFLLAAFLLYALACVLATRALVSADGRHMGRAVLLLTVAVAAAGLWTYLTWRGLREAENPPVVIARDGVALCRGNGPTYPPHPRLPQLHRGMEARLLHRRGGWLQVELPGGAVGWVPQAAALVD
jgi:tetratricopeptide (TPR) repeat protein